jgi:sugar lactone lactonase YvrE
MRQSIRTVLFLSLAVSLAATFAGVPTAVAGRAGAATAIQRDDLLPHLQEAWAARAKGDLPAATGALRRALGVVPGDPVVLFTLAQHLLRQGDREGALGVLDTLADLGSGYHPCASPLFARLADHPGYAALLAKLDRLEPPVVRSRPAFTLREPDLFPEGIACDPRDGTLYVSSVLKRKVVRVRPDGRVEDFIRPGQDGLLGTLGLKVDVRRGLLWVAASGWPANAGEANQSGLWAFDLASGRLAHRWLLPDSTSHTLNDLVLDRAGNVYVTGSGDGALYRARGPGGELETFLPPGTFRAPNGIAVSPDGRTLYVATSARGVVAVDLRTKDVAGVAVPAGVVTSGIDGLYARGRTLIAVQNGIGRPRVVRYFLRSPREIAGMEVLERRHPSYDEPTTAAIWKDRLFYVPNTHLDHTDANGALAPADSLGDPVILELGL